MANLKSTTIDDTGFLQLPSGTTGQRPSSPAAGEIRFNTDTKVTEWYDAELDAWFPTGVIPPVATGGDTVEDVDIDGVTYRIHSFTTVGSSDFTVTRGGSVDYLIVAGGGGGGYDAGGGGGGGGVLQGQVSLISGDYNLFVGSGGSPSDDVGIIANSGQNSYTFGLTAIGGGGGGGKEASGASGGSGGGSGHSQGDIKGGSSTPGQGNIGGGDTGDGGGGGGGAGEPGQDANPYGGKGGDGISSNITGNTLFYSGGGGGGNYDGPSLGGSGGQGGGGGGGGDGGSGTDGSVNTGGGGGAAGNAGTNYTWGDGGSGIVIIRYRIS